MISFVPFLKNAPQGSAPGSKGPSGRNVSARDSSGHDSSGYDSSGRDSSGENTRRADAAARNHALAALMQGVVLNAVPCTDGDLAAFIDSMVDLTHQVDAEATPERVATIVDAAVSAMSDQNRAALDYAAGRDRELEELRRIVGVFAGFVARSGFASRETVSAVQEITGLPLVKLPGRLPAKQPAAPPALSKGFGELAALRVRLSGCLEKALEVANQAAALEADDAVTGLGGPGAALGELAAQWGRRKGVWAVVFGIERMTSINARFGFQAADELLSKLSAHLRENLSGTDRLFRWRGPHLMAVIERDPAYGPPRIEMSRLAAWRTEHSIVLRHRDALVAVSVMWEIFPLSDFGGIEDVVTAVDGFVTARNRAMGQLPVLNASVASGGPDGTSPAAGATAGS